jgi:hypothetical protein
MERRVTNASVAGHPEFTVSFSDHPVVRLGVPWFLGWLETEVRSGKRFEPGQSLQVGWMYTLLGSRPDGTLSVLEPDFLHVPVRWVEQVSKTLEHLWFQREVATSFGIADALALPSYRESGIVCNRFGSASTLLLAREASSGTDSGWFLGCDEGEHDHQSPAQLERVSLYEAVLRNPRPVAYLGFPVGCFVRIGDGRVPWVALGDEVLPIKPGTLVARTAEGASSFEGDA